MLDDPRYRSVIASLAAIILGTACGPVAQDWSRNDGASQGLPVLGDEPLNRNVNAVLGCPVMRASEEVLISRAAYLLSYAPSRRTIHWAAWRLIATDLGSTDRQNNYSLDSDLETYLGRRGEHAVAADEYKGSCFDRGHQVPSGDRTSSVAINRQTFRMSNMLPQTPYLNRVIWEHMEAYERELTRAGKTLFIYSGGVYEGPSQAIGPRRDIRVPSATFKILAEVDSRNHVNSTLAVIMPNITSGGDTDAVTNCDDAVNDDLGEDSGSPDDWRQYITTLEAVERRAEVSLSFLHADGL